VATYAVGDPQGCLEPLQRLLDLAGFDPARDRLWCVGDLVNRGPDSLGVLRYFHDLGDRAVCVLGNHDLHLLAVAADVGESLRPKDTLAEVLRAPDRDELLAWLRHRPLVHHDRALGFTLVHAGLPPQWDTAAALARAGELEAVLRGPNHREYFAAMYGNSPKRWVEDLADRERLRFITNCFTRMRYVGRDGSLELKSKGPPGTQPRGLVPWFEAPDRRSASDRVLFGHWSTLQLHARVSPRHRVYPLDTGCVWGGPLTALRLDDERWVAVDCPQGRQG
jgi:bis(5'-nucleosyl)-tetraphosphatase (symmetrical)